MDTYNFILACIVANAILIIANKRCCFGGINGIIEGDH